MKTKQQHHTKLSAGERDLLAVWKAEGISNGECARRLGRHVSTIGRELKRNGWQGSYYVAIHAQAKAWEREEKKAHSKQPLKNPDVYAYVTQHLRDGWSPDQVAGRLKQEHPEDRHWSPSASWRKRSIAGSASRPRSGGCALVGIPAAKAEEA